MNYHPSEGYAITLRLKLENVPGVLGHVTSAIGEAGGNIGAIDIVEIRNNELVRDITVAAGNNETAKKIMEAVKAVPHVTFIHMSDRTFLMHIGGKIEVKSKLPPGIEPEMGPIATGLGEIFMYTVEATEGARDEVRNVVEHFFLSYCVPPAELISCR